MRDPLAQENTAKARFFPSGEEWRSLDPADYKAASRDEAKREQYARAKLYEEIKRLEPVCMVCHKEIPAYEPDEQTGERFLAHHTCSVPRQLKGAPLTKTYRYCVGVEGSAD